MKSNELFEALFDYFKEHPDFEETTKQGGTHHVKLPFDMMKIEEVIACRNCKKMIPAIQYDYEIFKGKSGSYQKHAYVFEESTILRYRCPACKAIQESRLIKKEPVT